MLSERHNKISSEIQNHWKFNPLIYFIILDMGILLNSCLPRPGTKHQGFLSLKRRGPWPLFLGPLLHLNLQLFDPWGDHWVSSSHCSSWHRHTIQGTKKKHQVNRQIPHFFCEKLAFFLFARCQKKSTYYQHRPRKTMVGLYLPLKPPQLTSMESSSPSLLLKPSMFATADGHSFTCLVFHNADFTL